MTETDRDAALLQALTRRNWIIFTVLVLVSLSWRSLPVTLGVACGGLIALTGHYWRKRSLEKILGRDPGGTSRFLFGYLLRLACFAAALYVMIVPLQLPPVAIVAGLSVVIINILITTVSRSF